MKAHDLYFPTVRASSRQPKSEWASSTPPSVSEPAPLDVQAEPAELGNAWGAMTRNVLAADVGGTLRGRSGLTVQRKTTLGEVGDRYEEEADRVAAQVVSQIYAPQPLRVEETSQYQAKAIAHGGISNQTGLPDDLKADVERLSGYSLDNVKVHYNSSQPAQIQALAYTQGTNIYVAPGQEKHLPHETWHIVQQRQGRVKPTMHTKGVQINNDEGLEKEADEMGKRTNAISGVSPHWRNAKPDHQENKTSIETSSSGREVIQRRTLMQPGYATGDQFAIVAMLIDDPKSHVVISQGPTEKGTQGYDPTDKAASIAQFYIDSGISLDRIHLVSVANIRQRDNNNPKKKLEEEAIRVEREVLGNRERIDYYRGEISNRDKSILQVGGGTNYVAGKFSLNMRKRIRKAWQVDKLNNANTSADTSKDEAIEAWLQRKGIPVTGGKVVVLWSRFSGKKGDIHLEHDSSYRGIEQIATAAARTYDAVIIAGDKGHSPEKAGKYDLMAAKVNKECGKNKVFNLTEFWNEKTVELQAWGGDTRIGQFKLYDYLHRKFGAKHLGFRSGNLEAMALLGYTVRYMEEPGSSGGDRMAKWHKTANGKTRLGGMAPGYERLEVSKPPTRSGKYLKRQEPSNFRPLWAPGRKIKPKPEAINDERFYKKGFEDADMERIRKYLELK